MPSFPRAVQVDLNSTPYYHCVSRCVRRAFLCGHDAADDSDRGHRKKWVADRLKLAADVFAIDVCAYAVLSNHYHTVLRVNPQRSRDWSEDEVISRYARFFPFAAKAVRDLCDETRSDRVAILRERLTSISWFMRVINEAIARRANREDGCTGRFWEGRFRSQAILDEGGLFACMSYVDLNLVRAGISSSLEESAFTSIEQRLRQVPINPRAKGVADESTSCPTYADVSLAPLLDEGRAIDRPAIQLRFDDYVELLEWTGRAARPSASGRISGAPPVLLRSLRIRPDTWLATMTQGGLTRTSTIGREEALDAEAKRRGKRWLKGTRQARALFLRAS